MHEQCYQCPAQATVILAYLSQPVSGTANTDEIDEGNVCILILSLHLPHDQDAANKTLPALPRPAHLG